MSRYNDSSAVKLERFPVERVQGQEDQQLEVLENRRTGRARPAAVPYGKYAVILACVFAVALGIVASYMRLAAVNLENARLRQQITELKSDENALNAKKEQLYNVLGMVKMDKSQVHYVEMDSGDRMVLAEASVSGGGEQGASLLDRLAKTFSTVLEYLN